jgi:D-alanine-D-alanine ligase-like ATP-grasp enzyme
MGAAIINDKIICKELFRDAGIRTPAWQTLTLDEFRSGSFTPKIAYPFVAKAPTQGYSFGIELISSPQDLHKLEDVFVYDDPIFIEQFIPGHNSTVGILETKRGMMVFPPVGHEFDGDKENHCLIKSGSTAPVVLREYSDSLSTELRSISEKVFISCRGGIYARVDFRISSEDGLPYVLEINGVPGLRTKGLYAFGAALSGLDYDSMIQTIVSKSKSRKSYV